MNARAIAAEVACSLTGAGIPDARFEAELLTRQAGVLDRAAYFAGAELSIAQGRQLRALVERRLRREPVAYLSGYREFYGLSFKVSPAVLIPRPETELLVEVALAELSGAAPRRVIDVGTGSGCVAIAVAVNATAAEVTGIDISADALAVSTANTRRHATGVTFARGHLVDAVGSADVIVANLPYIPAADISKLEPEVRDWEPRRALDGGPDGMSLIRALIQDCAARLRPRLLAMEVGFGQAARVAQLGRTMGARAEVLRDLAGIERVVCLRWQ